MHQRTRDAMKKRRKPLIDSINKFNIYVDKLRTSRRPEWKVAIPSKLPTDLKELQEDPDLLEDVWISADKSHSEPPPRWYTDVNVRRGIKAQLKLDRWYEEELCTLELAISFSEGTYDSLVFC